MRRPLVAFVLVLGLASAANAKPVWLGHEDARGDGEPDALSVAWAMDGELVVVVDLAEAPASTTELHVLWMRGTPGNQSPDEWYVIHVADNAQGLAGHGGQVREIPVNATWSEATLTLRWAPVDRSTAPCILLSAQVGQAEQTGFTPSDAVPDEAITWPTDACPALVEPSEGLQPAAKSTPFLGAPLLGLFVLVLSGQRRR